MKQVLFCIALMGIYNLSFSMDDNCSSSLEEDQCLICLNALNEGSYLTLECTHCYHQQCWNGWEFQENTRIIQFQSAKVAEFVGICCPLCKMLVDSSKIGYPEILQKTAVKCDQENKKTTIEKESLLRFLRRIFTRK